MMSRRRYPCTLNIADQYICLNHPGTSFICLSHAEKLDNTIKIVDNCVIYLLVQGKSGVSVLLGLLTAFRTDSAVFLQERLDLTAYPVQMQVITVAVIFQDDQAAVCILLLCLL